MNDLLKGWASVCLGSLAGAGLGAASFLTIEVQIPQSVEAGETWVEVYRKRSAPIPGTLGEELGIGGEVAFVDAQSIVRQGDFVYYNFEFSFLSPAGVVKSRPSKGSGRQANCRTQLRNTPRGLVPFADNWEGAAARFACR